MIIKSSEKDISAIMQIYKNAQEYMCVNGNTKQWAVGYPPINKVINEIKSGISYVLKENEIVYAVFTLIFGEDPTYTYIEGKWKNNNPYATIHGVASSGEKSGCFDECIEFCKSESDELRIDTHEDNHIMQYLIDKHGFEYCGVVFMLDNTPRIAYSWSKAK